MMNDEGWMMKDDDFKLLRGFDDRQTNERTDICDCRVAFATEKSNTFLSYRVVVMLSTVEMNVELHREVATALEQWDIKAT